MRPQSFRVLAKRLYQNTVPAEPFQMIGLRQLDGIVGPYLHERARRASQKSVNQLLLAFVGQNRFSKKRDHRSYDNGSLPVMSIWA